MLSFLEQLRRARNLRAILVIAALFASQSPLACAFEASADAETPGMVAAFPAAETDTGTDCCALCTDCQLGCVAAVTSRTHLTDLSFDIHPQSGIGPDGAAAKTWSPPTRLRPPIPTA